MITILHGDDIIESREALNKLHELNKASVLLDGRNLTLELLKQEVEGKLFGAEQPIFIENLLASPQKELVAFLTSQKESSIILWEDKEIKSQILVKFKKANVQNFKLKKALFTFLDSIRPDSSKTAIVLFHESLKTAEGELIFFMLVRHFRLMLAVSNDAKIDEIARLAPWQMSKTRTQANIIGAENLKIYYKKLFDIEIKLKTGSSILSLSQLIDFFLFGI